MPSGPEQHTTNFTFIYENCVWGNNGDKEYKGSSGEGSRLEHSLPYVCFLRGWLQGSGVASVCDVGCGDLRHFYPLFEGTGIVYTGYDIYAPLIDAHKLVPQYKNPLWTFEVKHCLTERDSMVSADVLILKDLLQHWTDPEVTDFMNWATTCGKYKFIFITNCAGSNGTLDTPGRFRGLSEDHPLLAPYKLRKMFAYATKRVLLWGCPG